MPKRQAREPLSLVMPHLPGEMDKRMIKQTGEEPLTKPQVIREDFPDGPCAVWGEVSGRLPNRCKARHPEGQRAFVFRGKEV